MHDTVERVVKACPVCQCNVHKSVKDQGPLRPIPASYPWEVVTVDFVSGFAPNRRNRHTACCVVCDRYTRMIHLETCRDHATAQETIYMLTRMVISKHGCPRVILTDRGTQFDSELWRGIWQVLGTRVAMATTHHPQTNGLTERLNRTLIDMIRKYTSQHPWKWGDYLPIFELAYNRSKHATTGVAPFMADRGYVPLLPAQLMLTPRQIHGDSSKTVRIHVDEL